MSSQITYELARELRDAGFPQDGDGGIYVNSDGSNKLEVDPRDGRIGYYIPTLEELMRACGEVTVEKKQDAPCEDNVVDTFTYEAFTADYSFVSDTPAEAVANLWLALNKKDK